MRQLISWTICLLYELVTVRVCLAKSTWLMKMTCTHLALCLLYVHTDPVVGIHAKDLMFSMLAALTCLPQVCTPSVACVRVYLLLLLAASCGLAADVP